MRLETKRNYMHSVSKPRAGRRLGRWCPSLATLHLRSYISVCVAPPPETAWACRCGPPGADRTREHWHRQVGRCAGGDFLSFMYGHAASNQQGPTPLPALLLPGCYSPAWPLCVSRDLERRPPAEGPKFAFFQRAILLLRTFAYIISACALRLASAVSSHYLAGVRCTRLVCP